MEIQKAKKIGKCVFAASFSAIPMTMKDTKDGDVIPHELQLESVSIIIQDQEFSAKVIELPRWAYNQLVGFISDVEAETIEQTYSSLPY